MLILIAVFLGILAGTITGITPGIHINLVSVIVVSLGFENSFLASVFIVAMAVTHTFIDIIPSIYLGAPEEDTALAVMPGHRLLLKGLGHEAVRLTIIGSLACLLLSVFLFPVFIYLFPIIYEIAKEYVGWMLIIIVFFMVFWQKDKNKIFWSFVVFLLSGILGLTVFQIKSLEQPLFPLLTGLFGMSVLIFSLKHKVDLPKQKTEKVIKVNKNEIIKSVFAGVFSGAMTSLLPGISSSHAALIAKTFFRKISSKSYLIIIGGVNTVNFFLSLATVYTLGKARNGAVVAVMQMMKNINLQELLIFVSASLIAGGIAVFLALKISKIFAVFAEKVNYRIICLSVVFLLAFLVLFFSGFLGFFVLTVSTSIGLIPILVDVRRSNCMGCLLLPVIIYLVVF